MESTNLANSFIESIKKTHGIDYSNFIDKIIEDIDEYVYNGCWVHTIVFEDEQYNELMPAICVIQEDEYDQHMADEDKPKDSKYVSGFYISLEK